MFKVLLSFLIFLIKASNSNYYNIIILFNILNFQLILGDLLDLFSIDYDFRIIKPIAIKPNIEAKNTAVKP